MHAAIHTRFFDSGSPAAPVRLRDGGSLPGITLAYETWGELDAGHSNAILVFHALSGSHHAAGFNPALSEVGDFWQPELHEGWWNVMIGPRRAIDTRKYFVICVNYLGGCYGSTGPSSINPATAKPWGASFPAVTAADQAEVACRLLDHLGIEQLNAVVGPSVGGLVGLTFATRFPQRVRKIISIAAGFKTTVHNRLILF
jgi:homoserine O-acetyltransferase